MQDRVFKIKLLSPDVVVPTKTGATWELYADSFAHNGMQDVTFDLHKSFYGSELEDINGLATKDGYILHPRGRILVMTGLSIELPINYYAEIIPLHNTTQYGTTSTALHSQGLLIEMKIIMGGEIDFVAVNLGHQPIKIKKGEAIAQMLITNIHPAQMQVIN